MAISLHTAGSWVAANATTQTVTLPTHSTGDMLLVRVGFKHATMPTTVTCGTAGWNKLGETNGTGGASSNGGGGVQVALFWKQATSAAETNPVITFNAGVTAATPSAAVGMAYSKAAGELWVTPAGAGTAIAAATSISDAIDSHISATSGDWIDEFHVTNDNTTLTVPTFTQAGLTLAAVTESPATALSSTTSNDISADGCFRNATAGTSSAAAVITGTNSVADLGAGWTTRLRVEVADPKTVTPDVIALATATFAPVVTATQNQTVTPSTLALTLTPLTPVVTASDHQLVTPDVVALTLSAFAPVVTASDHQSVTPGVASLSLATFAPTVTVEAGGVTVTPDAASLSLTTFAPTVTASDHQLVTPTPLSLAMTAFAPDVVISDHKIVTPDPATLTLSTFAPTVSDGAGLTVTPGAASLSLTTFAPSVDVGSPAVSMHSRGPTIGLAVVAGPAGVRTRTRTRARAVINAPRPTDDPDDLVILGLL